MKAYIVRRVFLIAAVLCMAAGILWSQNGISESQLAKLADDPAGKLTFPVKPLKIETAGGQVHEFNVEVAADEAHWAQGLMYRTSMDANAGMIFLMGRPPRVVSFWMKNTYIPLDMIFIAEDGTIANIRDSAPPESAESISSEAEVVAVLELNGGRAQALGIDIGDKIIFEGL